MNKKQIFGLVGFIGSGKDTVAKILETEYHFTRISFAGSLKDTLANIFGWRRELLEGTTEYSRIWRERVDSWWAQRLGIPEFTPRFAMQHFGTNVCRDHFHNDIWVASLERKLLNASDNIVVSDCRFTNEISSLRNAGGKIIWVQRGPMPVWYDQALQIMLHEVDLEQRNRKLLALGVHVSELDWLTNTFDYVLYNNGNLEQLAGNVKNLVSGLQVATE